MPSKTKTIREWKELVLESPAAAARFYFQQIETIPRDTQRRVFAALPSQDELLHSFEEARSHADKPLAGAPYLLKDLYDFPGYPTTASSSFLPEVRPAPSEEAELSQALRSEGAVFAGKTHLNEFAYGLSGENRSFGDCPHPVFPDRLSGGSSSGSAWAVRSGIAPLATGTDTAGSIRVPAAWCGLYGLRFSPNSWSRNGCFPLAPDFDTAGWMTANSEDMQTAIRALVPLQAAAREKPRGLNLFDAIPNLSPQFRSRSMDTIRKLDTETQDDALQAYRKASAENPFSYAVLQSIDAYQVQKDWLDAYRDRYDPVVWQRFDRARHWSEAQIEKASGIEQGIKAFFAACFEAYDFIVLPATQSPAIRAAEHTDAFRNELLAITAPASLARCPVLTVPITLENGETLGLQILYRDQFSDLPLRLLEALS
ncbi:amidase [Pelagicoccus sp. SDUM812005]|uniref:amidase n=1 Tax=Pelagicoccus sp. SDUM812005 TaxID=3041257 RepID=UPI00280C7CBC|nr:amidase [Pelagicoccus sp. SDUM812005]MDQ8182507.1 amidase [Pelagicoccus sp. SDUM812005]